MPESLPRSLAARFDRDPSTRVLRPAHDDAYQELRAQTCPLSREQWDALWTPGETGESRDRDMFEQCQLARYGLHEDPRAFVSEDLDSYMLYEWLTSNRADQAVAAKLARGLLRSGPSGERLFEACRSQQIGCIHALEQHGVEAPGRLRGRPCLGSSSCRRRPSSSTTKSWFR